MAKKNILLGVISLVLLICFFLGYLFFSPSHRDIKKETASFEVSSKALGSAFKNDPATANTKYLDKTLVVSGTVTDIDEHTLVLDHVVLVRLESPGPVKKNTFVRVKGRCIGYDDLLEEVRLEQCHLLPN